MIGDSLEGPSNLRPTYGKGQEDIWREIRKLWSRINRGGSGRLIDKTWTLPGRMYAVTSNKWYAPNFGGRIVHIRCSLTTAGSTASTVRLLINAVTKATITIPSGADNVFSSEISEFITGDTDPIQIQVVTAGTGATGLLVQIRYSEI